MLPLLEAIVLASIVGAAADSVPRLDVDRFCADIAQRAAPLADKETCRQKEEETREQLVRTWTGFDPADRAHCVRLMTAGDAEATYTALLTCLEVERDARTIREKNQDSTTERR